MGQQFGLRGNGFRKPLLQNLGKPLMMVLPCALEQ
jgi:hypothetical protein